MLRSFLLACILILPSMASGCGDSTLFSASVWDPFGVTWRLDPHAEPVRIGLSYEQSGIFDVRRWGKSAPWDALVRELSADLGRPVIVENLEPFQIEFHLRETGRLQFALITADDYLAMTETGPPGRVLGLSEGRTRQGVIVASAKSDIREIADLKGERFAFGPRAEAVLHQATVAFLAEGGVDTSDLLLLVPGLLQFHISSREAAKEVAYGLTRAGVIEAAEFDAYPDTGGKWIPFAETFSKDQFRELGRTPLVREDTMGEGPFVAGDQTDPETVEKVRRFLLSAETDSPQVVRSLGFARFRPAPADPMNEIKRLAKATSR